MLKIAKSRRFFILAALLLPAALLYWHSLPEPLFNEPVSTIIRDRDQQLLGAHIARDQQWRFPPIEQAPDKFTTSLVQFEDKRFWQHPGIDPVAISRAIVLNLKHGGVVSGASTLSMQVIRLSRKQKQRTFTEKLKEMLLALRLEMRYSKTDILKLYASYAPFGGNIVGLEAASWRYFGRRPEQLSWAEHATLAVLPNSPALIHPGRQRQQLKKKRDILLSRLHERGFIEQLEYELAVNEPLPQKPHPLPRLAPHLLDTLSQSTASARIGATLDKSLQEKAMRIVDLHAQRLKLESIHNLALLVIDNKDLSVKAYIGNSSSRQTGEHGHAIDLIHKPRSTGSTLKPLLFAHMIQAGEILPETLVADVPVRYAGFRPQNYDRSYRGAVRAKQALARSLNIPAANMLSQYGVERLQSDLKNMGMTTLHRQAGKYGLTLILGGAEGTLWELTGLYANLARLAGLGHGQAAPYWLRPTILQGKEAAKHKPAQLSSASAWMTLQALLEVSRPGNDGYWRKFSSTRKIAWKTGTSFGQRDAWALGVTPRYTVGVWAGNASGQGVAGLTGTRIAAPLLFDIFNLLPDDRRWFEKPHWQFKTIDICKNDGYLAANGCGSMAYEVPINSFFDRISPYHQRIHLDRSGDWQVHSGCESVSNMQHLSWFILPPDQAHYFQQNHAYYRNLPSFRPDCRSAGLAGNLSAGNNPISLLYPQRGTQIYIPVQLDGKAGKAVFKALHQNPEMRLYWHIDEQFIGSTTTFHEQAIWIKAGDHQLTIVDDDGNRREQQFTVLQKDSS